jgi:hypothetical protein
MQTHVPRSASASDRRWHAHNAIGAGTRTDSHVIHTGVFLRGIASAGSTALDHSLLRPVSPQHKARGSTTGRRANAPTKLWQSMRPPHDLGRPPLLVLRFTRRARSSKSPPDGRPLAAIHSHDQLTAGFMRSARARRALALVNAMTISTLSQETHGSPAHAVWRGTRWLAGCQGLCVHSGNS